MEKRPPRPMTPFDELVSSPQLQVIKLLLPYAPPSGRRMLAALVKFLELRRAVRVFNGPATDLGCPSDGSNPRVLIDSIKPYLDPKEMEMMETIMNMRDIMSMAEMMQESSGRTSSFDPADLMMGMLSPEQQEMFSTYSDMFSQALSNDRKGDDNSGRMDEQSRTEEHRSGEAGTDPDGGRPDQGKDRT